MELRISWQIFFAISALHGSTPGTLFKWYTSLSTLQISSQVVLKPMSLTVGTPHSSLTQAKAVGGPGE